MIESNYGEDEIPWSINAGMRIDIVRAAYAGMRLPTKKHEEPVFTIHFGWK